MSKHRPLSRGEVLPASFLAANQEFISTLSSNLQVLPSTSTSTTSVFVPAGTGNDQAALGIQGLWRYNTEAVSAAHPGGLPGWYGVWATTSANSFTDSPLPDTDSTNYAFGLVISLDRPDDPAISRKIASVYWTGTRILGIRNLLEAQTAPLLMKGTYAERPPAAQFPEGTRYTQLFSPNYSWLWEVSNNTWVFRGGTTYAKAATTGETGIGNGSDVTKDWISLTAPHSGAFDIRASGRVTIFYSSNTNRSDGYLQLLVGSTVIGTVAETNMSGSTMMTQSDSGHLFVPGYGLSEGGVVKLRGGIYSGSGGTLGGSMKAGSIELVPAS